MAHAVHVPAWKKLGLKLKYANDIPIDDIPIENTVSSTNVKAIVGEKKRKENGHINDNTTPLRPTKKAKKALVTNVTVNGADSFATSTEAESQDAAISPSPPKRKSVSFTPDTKTKDGESTKELYRAYRAQQEASLGANTSDPKYKALAQTLDGGEAARLKKGKKDKSRTSKKSGTSLSSTDQSHTPGLQYLIQYYADRSAWKFNKNQQTALLKYIFDPGRVPLSYDLALQAYLSGLESTSQRKRLRAIAFEIRKFDDEFLKLGRYPDPEETDKETKQDSVIEVVAMDQAELDRRSAQYNQALEFYKRQLKSQQITSEERQKDMTIVYQANLQRRKRAELVLSAIGESELDSPTNASSATKSVAPSTPSVLATPLTPGINGYHTKEPSIRIELPVRSAKKIRKRKRRTQISDDESSSSSSSSSSSDSDSSDDIANASIKTTKSKKSSRVSNSNSGASSSDDAKSKKAKKYEDVDLLSDKYSEAATNGSTIAEFSDDESDTDEDNLKFEDLGEHGKGKEVIKCEDSDDEL